MKRTGDQPFAEFFETNPLFRRFVADWFRFSQRLGFDIIPNHFYQPVPNLEELAKKDWEQPSSAGGLSLNLERQRDFLRDVVTRYRDNLQFPEAPDADEFGFYLNNGYYNSFDAEILYCMIRHFQPRRIFEIGSGHSTRVAARAVSEDNRAGECELVAIEPFPEPWLKAGFRGLTRLHEGKVQDLGLAYFEQLEANDILFIDSSHVVKAKNDVVFEYLEVLPHLKPGVLVHVHDVFIPWDYPRKWVIDCYKFWSEQYLLQAFLAFNTTFEVLWASAAMARSYPQELARAFPRWNGSFTRLRKADQISTATLDGRNVWPCAFWMRRSA